MVTLWPRSPALAPTNFAWSFLFSLLFFLHLLPPFSFPVPGWLWEGERLRAGGFLSKTVVVAVVAVSPPEHVWICVVVLILDLGLVSSLLHGRDHH